MTFEEIKRYARRIEEIQDELGRLRFFRSILQQRTDYTFPMQPLGSALTIDIPKHLLDSAVGTRIGALVEDLKQIERETS